MKLLTTSQFNELTAQRNRGDSQSLGRDRGHLQIADYIMTVEITQDWVQENNAGAWFAMARRVAFDDGDYTTQGDEFPIYNPTTPDKPDNAVGDRVAVCDRGRWEIIGGGGGTVELIDDILASTLISGGTATTNRGYIVYAPVLANGRAAGVGTNITHLKGRDGRQYVVNVESYTTALALNTPTLTTSGNGVQVAVPNWMSTTGLGIQWCQYHPTKTWTSISNVPSWPHVFTPVNPGWVFVRLYSTVSGSNIIAGPWAAILARGSLADSDLFVASPTPGTPTTTVTVTPGSWYDSLPSDVKTMYTLQTGYMASGNVPPSSWSNTGSQTIPVSGTRDVWARFDVENRASVSSFGSAYASQAIAGVKLGTWSRT